jgi:hypothetical protein
MRELIALSALEQHWQEQQGERAAGDTAGRDGLLNTGRRESLLDTAGREALPVLPEDAEMAAMAHRLRRSNIVG